MHDKEYTHYPLNYPLSWRFTKKYIPDARYRRGDAHLSNFPRIFRGSSLELYSINEARFHKIWKLFHRHGKQISPKKKGSVTKNAIFKQAIMHALLAETSYHAVPL